MDPSIEQTQVLQRFASAGKPFEETGMPEELRPVFDVLRSEVQALAKMGIVPEMVNEWPDISDEDSDRFYGVNMSDEEYDAIIAQFAEPEDDATLVSKAVDEQRFTLGPMYIPNRKDAHAEWTDPDELQKAVWDYVKKGDRTIRLQHDRDTVAGEWVEVMSWPFEVEAPLVLKNGGSQSVKFPPDTVFLGVHWEPWAWELVKADKLRGYSIGGKAQRLLVDLPDESESGS